MAKLVSLAALLESGDLQSLCSVLPEAVVEALPEPQNEKSILAFARAAAVAYHAAELTPEDQKRQSELDTERKGIVGSFDEARVRAYNDTVGTLPAKAKTIADIQNDEKQRRLYSDLVDKIDRAQAAATEAVDVELTKLSNVKLAAATEAVYELSGYTPGETVKSATSEADKYPPWTIKPTLKSTPFSFVVTPDWTWFVLDGKQWLKLPQQLEVNSRSQAVKAAYAFSGANGAHATDCLTRWEYTVRVALAGNLKDKAIGGTLGVGKPDDPYIVPGYPHSFAIEAVPAAAEYYRTQAKLTAAAAKKASQK